MHIAESYALLSASKINKPWVNSEYYPISSEKYISFHNGSTNPARKYDHWPEVIKYIAPVLKREGIDIVQVGGQDDEYINGALDARGSSKRQMQHIIYYSMMFLGNDTCSAHFASAMSKKIVMVHSCLYPENSRPYWSSSDDCSILEAPRGDNKPSFSIHEAPKTINNIKPECIANEIFKMLRVSDRINETTEFIGHQFPLKSFDIIPTKPYDPRLANIAINFRLDLHYDLTHLSAWASFCNVNIMTKRSIPLEYLAPFKGKILAVQCDASHDFSEEDIKQMRKSGTPVNFFYKGDEEGLRRARIKYFDEHIFWLNAEKPNLESLDNLFVYSNRTIVDHEAEYLTEWHFYGKIPLSERMPVCDRAILDCSEYLRIVRE